MYEDLPDTAAARAAQVGLPARRAAAELLFAVLERKQPLEFALLGGDGGLLREPRTAQCTKRWV